MDVVRSGSLTDVTPAQRRRMDEVEKALTAGEGWKLYRKDKLKETGDQGGLDLDRAKTRLEALANRDESKSQAVFDGLVAKWDDKHGPAVNRKLRSHINRDESVDLRIASPEKPQPLLSSGVPDPAFKRCSFCGEWTHKDRVTQGVGPLDKRRSDEIKIYPHYSGEQTFSDSVTHYTKVFIACPEHALMISKVKFPGARG